jgi:hypothetical protein
MTLRLASDQRRSATCPRHPDKRGYNSKRAALIALTRVMIGAVGRGEPLGEFPQRVYDCT